jgi:hypothetical protein
VQRRRLLASALLALPVGRAPAATAGAFSFAVLGDAPYGRGEEREFDRTIDQINADSSLRFAVHVGDLKAAAESCSDALLARRFAALERMTLPWLYTPGDNDWTDCHVGAGGRFNPLERLQFLRRVHFGRGERAHGPNGFAVVPQPGCVENARFEIDGIVMATLHVVGSDNGLAPWRGIDLNDRAVAPRPERIAEVRARSAAALAWVDTAFDHAQQTHARAVVLFFHANPSIERSVDYARRKPFNAFVARIHDRARAFGRPVLLAHGDYHWYFVDAPFADLANVVRMQVPGSPFAGWVKVSARDTGDAGTFFRFDRSTSGSQDPP